jgi:hypothetical protein
MRDVSVSFIVFGNGYQDQFSKRRTIKSILNPQLGEGTLKYQNDYFTTGKNITVKIDAEPQFSTSKDGFGYHAQICGFTMTAYYPYWEDLTETSTELVGLTGGFVWDDADIPEPIYFESATAFYMGEIDSASAVLTNLGDVPAPLTIEWIGAAENPKITLEDTGEYILLEKVLGADEKLTITTGYGDKNVYIEDLGTGDIDKDFSLVDSASTFFSLPVGTSTISLTADTGAASAAVTLKWTNLYIGV